MHRGHMKDLVEKNSLSDKAHIVEKQEPQIEAAKKTSQKKQKRKVAFVDIEGTLIINGVLNVALVEQLKESEYDEVILFAQRTDGTMERVALALKEHGIHLPPFSAAKNAPKNKIEQYRDVLAQIKDQHDEDIDVSMFDSHIETLKEMIESTDIPKEDKPLAYNVINQSIFPLAKSLPLAEVDGLDSNKYKEIKLKNYALLVAYFIEIKKLNAAEINENVDPIIKALLMPGDDDLNRQLVKIAAPLEALIGLGDALKTPACAITMADLAASIAGSDQKTQAKELLDWVRKENEIFYAKADDSERSMLLNDVRTLTAGDYHVEMLLPMAEAKYKDFYDFLMVTPLTENNLPAIEEKIAAFFSVWGDLKIKNEALTNSPINSTSHDLLNGAIIEFITHNEIDILALYKLMAFNNILLEKSEQGEDFEPRIIYSQYYNVLRNIDLAEMKLMRPVALAKGISKEKEIDAFVEKNHGKMLELMLMQKLVKETKLIDVPREVAALFPNKDARDNFNRRFFDYQIQNAYQIHIWQMDLSVGEKIEREVDKIFKAKYAKAIPESYGEYVLQTQGEAAAKSAVAESVNQAIKEKEYTTKIKPSLRNRAIDASFDEVEQNLQGEFDQSSQEISQQFVLNIKKMIEETRWEVSIVQKFATTVGLGTEMVSGVALPTNVARIYRECIKAERNENWGVHFDAIAKIGIKASTPHRFDFFGLTKRDVKTQEFYDLFKKAYEEKAKVTSSNSR